MVKQKEKVVIRFKHFTIIVEDGKEDEFIKKLDKLCDKYQASKNGAFYSYEIEE